MIACRRICLLLAALWLAGCESLAYYGQSINGQLEVMARSRPIEDVLADPALSPERAAKLRLVQRLRRFAHQKLALPDNGSYRQVADLGRRAVVWSVTATPPYDVTPKTWCYPVAGCLSYRGYFAQADARAKAAELRGQGLDVAVLPVPAYSTLGWFADPLPSTVIHWPEAELAGLIFHELAHQRLYVPDDTAFNEAYASSVAEQGVRLWLNGREADREAWLQRDDQVAQVSSLLLATRTRLQQAFASSANDAERRARKRRIYRELTQDYRRLSADWSRPRPYDHWFGDDGINNAHLAQVATYDHWVPAFNALWRQAGDDAARFHQRAAAIGALPAEQRMQALQALMPRSE